MKTQSRNIVLLIAALITYLLFYFSVHLMPEMSGLPYAVNRALLGCLILKIIDEFMLNEIDTMKILKTDAKAYSLYMLGYAIVIALAFATA